MMEYTDGNKETSDTIGIRITQFCSIDVLISLVIL